MRLVGFILAASIGLAALKITLTVLLLLYPLVLLWAVVVRPRELMGFGCFAIGMFLLDKHPLATLATIVALFTVGVCAKAFR